LLREEVEVEHVIITVLVQQGMVILEVVEVVDHTEMWRLME
jgi:hypothetical protein